ncbi:acetyltransferase [Agarivorans sp. JK6]|uniref:acetyltransferase n=1 Tax=Agarivorans sp. JK6 TaxID=2997426 RepID=UPI00387383A0
MSNAKGKPIVILGGGGHALVLAEILYALQLPLIAVVSDSKPEAAAFKGLDHIGNDELLVKAYAPDEIELVNGIGQMPGNLIRNKVSKFYEKLGYQFTSVISPTAIVSPSARLAPGIQILDGAVVHGEARIGEHSIVNTSAIIEHDCHIGASCHIAPRAVLCGGVKVANGTHVGVGATLIQQVTVSENCLIGAGAVVTKNIPFGHKVYSAKSIVKPELV